MLSGSKTRAQCKHADLPTPHSTSWQSTDLNLSRYRQICAPSHCTTLQFIIKFRRLGNARKLSQCHAERFNHLILTFSITTNPLWFSQGFLFFLSFYVILLTSVEICPIVKCTGFFVYSVYRPISHQSQCIPHSRILSLCGRIGGL